MSPLASTSADLQSIIPAPVSSRSLRTTSAVMLLMIPSSIQLTGGDVSAVVKSPGGRLAAPRGGDVSPGRLGPGNVRPSARRGPVRDRRAPGGGPAARRRRRLGLGQLRLAQAAAGEHRVGDLAREQPDRAQGVVVARDQQVDLVRVAVGVDDADDGDLRACAPRRPRSPRVRVSITKTASGTLFMLLMPREVLLELAALLVEVGELLLRQPLARGLLRPVSVISSSRSRSRLRRTVTKFVSRPPSQRSVT